MINRANSLFFEILTINRKKKRKEKAQINNLRNENTLHSKIKKRIGVPGWLGH